MRERGRQGELRDTSPRAAALLCRLEAALEPTLPPTLAYSTWPSLQAVLGSVEVFCSSHTSLWNQNLGFPVKPGHLATWTHMYSLYHWLWRGHDEFVLLTFGYLFKMSM